MLGISIIPKDIVIMYIDIDAHVFTYARSRNTYL